jgi:hypothetical protein
MAAMYRENGLSKYLCADGRPGGELGRKVSCIENDDRFRVQISLALSALL